MNEPLNNTTPKINFAGKTYNNHPQWYNQPLRLTNEQRSNPSLVLDDFFECYHLNDVRKILREWTTDILSSPCSISIEPQHRNDHIYFYEKIEGFIEAAFLIQKKIHRKRRKKEKQKLKKQNLPGKDQVLILNNSIRSNEPSITVESENFVCKFNKPPKLIEYVNEDPKYVIDQVFQDESLTNLMDQLRDWLFVALSADCSIYEGGEQRGLLLSFQSQLLVLVEALYIINIQYGQEEEKKTSPIDKTRLLNQEQIANPMQVLATFFEQFPMVYIVRELEDWLEASICFSGTPPEDMHDLQALWTFRNVLCLVKSAKQLLNK